VSHVVFEVEMRVVDPDRRAERRRRHHLPVAGDEREPRLDQGTDAPDVEAAFGPAQAAHLEGGGATDMHRAHAAFVNEEGSVEVVQSIVRGGHGSLRPAESIRCR